jgi:hypothetical protein
MDKVFRELRELTLQFVNEINDLAYEQVVEFVEQRELLINQLQSSPKGLPQTYEQDVRDILQYDTLIKDRIKALGEEANAAITKVDQARSQRKAYEIVHTPDSVFFDKKN